MVEPTAIVPSVPAGLRACQIPPSLGPERRDIARGRLQPSWMGFARGGKGRGPSCYWNQWAATSPGTPIVFSYPTFLGTRTQWPRSHRWTLRRPWRPGMGDGGSPSRGRSRVQDREPVSGLRGRIRDMRGRETRRVTGRSRPEGSPGPPRRDQASGRSRRPRPAAGGRRGDCRAVTTSRPRTSGDPDRA